MFPPKTRLFLRILLLSLVFRSFTTMYLRILSCLEFIWLLESVYGCLSSFFEIFLFSHTLFKYYFCPFIFSSFEIPISCKLELLTVSHLCCIWIFLPIYHPVIILSFTMSKLLLKSSNVLNFFCTF